jgi:hypothetical protein
MRGVIHVHLGRLPWRTTTSNRIPLVKQRPVKSDGRGGLQNSGNLSQNYQVSQKYWLNDSQLEDSLLIMGKLQLGFMENLDLLQPEPGGRWIGRRQTGVEELGIGGLVVGRTGAGLTSERERRYRDSSQRSEFRTESGPESVCSQYLEPQ